MKIVVKGMSAGYGSSEILKDIDLEIGSGEKVFIGGSNGSGKTTLLKVMSGLIPHKGTVTVDGKEISKMKRKEAAKLISLMPQTSEVYFPYTVRETVMLGTYASSGSILGGAPLPQLNMLLSAWRTAVLKIYMTGTLMSSPADSFREFCWHALLRKSHRSFSSMNRAIISTSNTGQSSATS